MSTRRDFLRRLSAGVAGVFVADDLFDLIAEPRRKLWPGWRREPWIGKGELADHIGRHRPGGFIGAAPVVSVGAWNGQHYPVTLAMPCWPARTETHPDTDLAAFHREVPLNFWWLEGNRRRYPNVHTYVRTQRYGESVEHAIRHLNFTSTEKWLSEGWQWTA